MAEKRYLQAVTIALAAVNIVLFLIIEITTGSTMDSNVLLKWGAFYTPYVQQGEYWRLFTAMFLHAGIQHLLNNMLLLVALGITLEPLIGHVRFLAVYLLGGLAGNLASFYFYAKNGEAVISVGASGAVFAVMGALIWVIIRNKGRVKNLSLMQMAVMLALSLYFGLVAANVANTAHIGGLIAGFILSMILYRKPKTAVISQAME
ncbi:MAG: rhomboid family intramembrane serine protease [Lachnospiraceae bacterium]|jgi:rhomboid protease GluP|nr:rhomboid family intramembrane serine protease [Lachnospiraceae bacterium]MCI1727036.1 rhomboid family intramembrane serine protease [Lachnospiraceae bacterium]